MSPRRCIGVVVHVAPPLRVLLLRRPEARSAGWQAVTGRVEPEDEARPRGDLLLGDPATPETPALVAACVREIQEETGLPEPLHVEDLGLEREFVGYDGQPYRQRFFAARFPGAHAPVRTPEHEEARWVDAQEALALMRWENDKEAVREILRRLDASPPPPQR